MYVLALGGDDNEVDDRDLAAYNLQQAGVTASTPAAYDKYPISAAALHHRSATLTISMTLVVCSS